MVSCGIESGGGDSDQRVLVSHLPLGGGNVGTPLQQVRRHAQRNRRRSCIQRTAGMLKVDAGIPTRTAMACSILRALLLHQIKLRDGRIEQRLLLRQVESGSDSACVTALDQLQALLLNVDRFLDDLLFGVELAQTEVVGGKFGGEDQIHVVQIGCGGLQRRVGGLQAALDLAEEIRLVVQQETESQRYFA